MSTVLQIALSVIAALAAVGIAYFGARRFRKLGGDEAQERLNEIRRELDAAQTEKIRLMAEDFAGCKARLFEVEDELKRLRRDRADDRREISDLHAELRKLQPDRRGRQDRSDD